MASGEKMLEIPAVQWTNLINAMKKHPTSLQTWTSPPFYINFLKGRTWVWCAFPRHPVVNVEVDSTRFGVIAKKARKMKRPKRFSFHFTWSKWSRIIWIQDQFHDAEFYFCAIWCPHVGKNKACIITRMTFHAPEGTWPEAAHICVSTQHILMGTDLFKHPQSGYFRLPRLQRPLQSPHLSSIKGLLLSSEYHMGFHPEVFVLSAAYALINTPTHFSKRILKTHTAFQRGVSTRVRAGLNPGQSVFAHKNPSIVLITWEMFKKAPQVKCYLFMLCQNKCRWTHTDSF